VTTGDLSMRGSDVPAALARIIRTAGPGASAEGVAAVIVTQVREQRMVILTAEAADEVVAQAQKAAVEAFKESLRDGSTAGAPGAAWSVLVVYGSGMSKAIELADEASARRTFDEMWADPIVARVELRTAPRMAWQGVAWKVRSKKGDPPEPDLSPVVARLVGIDGAELPHGRGPGSGPGYTGEKTVTPVPGRPLGAVSWENMPACIVAGWEIWEAGSQSWRKTTARALTVRAGDTFSLGNVLGE
jgi:hypothetical protein